MKIIHFCQYKVRHSNGIQAAVWELAKHQARLGHDVEIISLGRMPHADEVEIVSKEGIKLTGYAGGFPKPAVIARIVERLSGDGDCVCHVHSVFIPWHSLLCRSLYRSGVRYFVSPHGNLLGREMARKRLKKEIYFRCIEAPVLKRAAGILCVSEPEVERVNSLLGRGLGMNLGNGVDSGMFNDLPEKRQVPEGKVSGVFLGKSDVLHKGFDRMFHVAKRIPGGVDFFVIRHNQAGMTSEFDNLLDAYAGDDHVRVKPPVYTEEKVSVLGDADLYLHLPRWEVFGMAIIEAAMAGLPLVLSSDCDLADEAESAGAALILSPDNEGGFDKLDELIADKDALREMGEKARRWAMETYSSEVVASRSISFYQRGASDS